MDAQERILDAILAFCTTELDCSTVTAADGFFAIGGESVLAVQLVADLEERFSLELPLELVFEAATIGDMATAVASYMD